MNASSSTPSVDNLKFVVFTAFGAPRKVEKCECGEREPHIAEDYIQELEVRECHASERKGSKTRRPNELLPHEKPDGKDKLIEGKEKEKRGGRDEPRKVRREIPHPILWMEKSLNRSIEEDEG